MDQRVPAKSWSRRSVLLGAGTLAAGAVLPAPAARAGDGAGAPLDTVLADRFAGSPAVPGIIARVDAPRLHWAGAVGVSDRATGEPLRSGYAFRTASVTKTFTATAVLALAGRGRVDLDASVTAYLPAAYVGLLRDGGYDPARITVRHLLTHRSGLYDFGTDDGYLQAVLTDLQHRWTPAAQVAWAMTHGEPAGPPGGPFHYSDTGYVLLARVVEAATGLPQAVAYRRLLRFGRLRLTSTWFETLEAPPATAGPRAHQYFVYPAAGLDVDLYPADPSYDLYGGGGLVSTVRDLNRFYAALLTGRLLGPAQMREMLALTPSDEGPAGMGIFATDLAGARCWWHSGFIGTVALYCPRYRLAVSLTVDAFTAGTTEPGALADAVDLASTAIGELTR